MGITLLPVLKGYLVYNDIDISPKQMCKRKEPTDLHLCPFTYNRIISHIFSAQRNRLALNAAAFPTNK